MAKFVSLDGLREFLARCKGVFALKTEIPATLPASDTTDQYTADGKVPVSGIAVKSALGGMTEELKNNNKVYDDDEITSVIDTDDSI